MRRDEEMEVDDADGELLYTTTNHKQPAHSRIQYSAISDTCCPSSFHHLKPDPNVKRKGRGFNIRGGADVQMDGVKAKTFDRLDGDEEGETKAARCE